MSFKPDSSEENSLEWALRQFWRISDADSLHTAGNSPTLPATGSSWNAHGNTATGAAGSADSNTGTLIIDEGAFLVGKSGAAVGTTPDIDQAGTYMAFIPAKGAFRMGAVTDGKWADANIGSGSIAMGLNSVATQTGNVALGETATATGIGAIAFGGSTSSGASQAVAFQSIALGANTEAGTSSFVGVGAIAIGIGCKAYATYGTTIGYLGVNSAPDGLVLGKNNVAGAFTGATAIGLDVSASAAGAISIGSGAGPGSRLDNPTAGSMYLGAKSADPTLVLRGGKCGVGNEPNPLSTLDVNGSVGYQYRTWVQSVDGSTLTILTSEHELVFIIYPDGGDVTVNLPAMATLDRRMYHIKNAATASGSAGHQVNITPTGGDLIDQQAKNTAPATTALAVDRLDSVQLVADLGHTTWWVI